MLQCRFVQLDLFSVNDEARMFCDLSIEIHGNVIRFMGEPINARRTSSLCLLINCFDERTTNSLTPRRFSREQVLQIAVLFNYWSAVMKQIMTKPTSYPSFWATIACTGSLESKKRDQVVFVISNTNVRS